jgi:two-component system phosphate regulon sensor histidine kinase PhoR
LKVKVLYDEFYTEGSSLNKNLLKKDAQSLTRSIQNFAKESKLEIELLKVKDNYRKEFIGNVAHELKTPLFTVESYILTLLEGAVEDEDLRNKYLQKAAQSIDRLNHIVNDLDLITKFEAGIASIQNERFDLIVLIDEVLGLMEIRAKERKIDLTFEKPIDNDTLWVEADRKRISQVITNLVVNSLKYGVNGGTTEITIGFLSKQKILVRVIDNGNGIEEKHIPRLFERFYRIDKARNRDGGGSGLGLAIVKHIIEAHKEKIYVQSTFGVGSEFSFSLSKTK